MSEKRKYKSCFVPNCGSSTIKTPNKLFFCVPKNENTRKKWFKVARRSDQPKQNNTYYCCQDHFNVSKYIKIKIYWQLLK